MTTVKCLTETSQYYRDINAAVEMLEEKYPIEVLFAAAIGSVAMGLDNKTSDIDLYVVFRTGEKYLEFGDFKKYFYEYDVNMFMVDIRLLEKNVAYLPYDELVSKYSRIMPSNLHYHNRFDYSLLPGTNNCKLTAFLGELLFAGLIYDKRRFLVEHLSRFSHLMNIYNFCKRRYISSYGRLTNYLIEQGNVRLRSYLNTMYEILTIAFLLSENKMPPHQFDVLIKLCKDEGAAKIINEFYILNKQSLSKEKLIIDPVPELNAYISHQLELIKPKIIELYNTRHEETFDVNVVY